MPNKQPCIECEHLKIDRSKLAALRLKNDLSTHIRSTCNKDIYESGIHSLRFLLQTIKDHGTHDNHIAKCQYFESYHDKN